MTYEKMKVVVEQHFHKKVAEIQQDRKFFYKGIPSGVLMELYPEILPHIMEDLQKFDGFLILFFYLFKIFLKK